MATPLVSTMLGNNTRQEENVYWNNNFANLLTVEIYTAYVNWQLKNSEKCTNTGIQPDNFNIDRATPLQQSYMKGLGNRQRILGLLSLRSV